MIYKDIDTTQISYIYHNKKEGWTSYRMNDDTIIKLTPEEVEELNKLMENEDNSFNDATCPKCGKRIGWTGLLIDRPPCPRCGHSFSKEELQETQNKLDALEKEMLKD